MLITVTLTDEEWNLIETAIYEGRKSYGQYRINAIRNFATDTVERLDNYLAQTKKAHRKLHRMIENAKKA